MQKFIAFALLAFSFSSFAEERVVLNSKSVSINASEAVIVRTSETPNQVTLTLQVPMSNSVCELVQTRHTMRASGLHCGYHLVVVGHRETRVCIRRNPVNNQCVNYQVGRSPVTRSVPRTCLVPESYCARYGTSTQFESDEVKIKFKNLPSLGGSEEETFKISARQERRNGSNVEYDIDSIQTVGEYEIKDRGLFGSDKYVIQPK